MITVSKNIHLQKITLQDSKKLYGLIKEIYPPAYDYFWKDKGHWYVEEMYHQKNIEKELLEKKADYYFILFDNQLVGNFRILWDEQLPGAKPQKTVKLHRLYLHPKTQGKGVGKQLIEWLITEAKLKNYELLWLDAMNEKKQAFEFYKNRGFTYHSHCNLDYKLLYKKYQKMSQVYLDLRD